MEMSIYILLKKTDEWGIIVLRAAYGPFPAHIFQKSRTYKTVRHLRVRSLDNMKDIIDTKDTMDLKRKMLFFDIDGTLIPEGRSFVPDSTYKALVRAHDHGHLLFINTGRTWFNVDPYLRELPFDGYVCGCGTYICYHGRQLLSRTIPHDRCIKLIQLMRLCNIPGFYEEKEHIYFDTHAYAANDTILKDARRMFGTKAFEFPDDIHDPSFTFDKILAFLRPDSDIETFRKYSDDFLEYINRGHGIAEITQKDCSKATGIRFLCDHLNIPLEHCFAFGDSPNDLSMLDYVPVSIAMGNSTPAVKERCSYVTDDVEHNGIYNAMKHFGLIA